MGQFGYTRRFSLLTYFTRAQSEQDRCPGGEDPHAAFIAFFGSTLYPFLLVADGNHHGTGGIYRTAPFLQGFQDSLLTMGLLASLALRWALNCRQCRADSGALRTTGPSGASASLRSRCSTVLWVWPQC